MIKFSSDKHLYQSTDTANPVDWIGVTSMVSFFKPDFDPVTSSVKASKNSRSKWYKIPPEEIQQIWKGESKRSLDMGTWYHDKEEALIRASHVFNSLKVVEPIFEGLDKLAPSQQLTEGHVYPEHLTYLRTDGICGQVDRVEVENFRVNIRDYKTSKTIKTEGFTNWEGITAKMKDPLSHLEDCNFVHYSLQMSLYLYMILKHNPFLSPGKLTLDHIIFEQESTDKFGYPVYSKDPKGNFIVQEIKSYSVHYLRDEVIAMLHFLKANRELVKSHIKTNKH